MDEKTVLKRLKENSVAPKGSLYAGDDAAFLKDLNGTYITTDTTVENVHFFRNIFSNYDLAYRAIGTALSDLAAMGAVPKYILVALGLPTDFKISGLLNEIAEVAKNFNVVSVGGDISNSTHIFVNVTCIGVDASASDLKLLNQKRSKQVKDNPNKSDNFNLRRALKPGQLIFVTGQCGLSQKGFEIAKILHECENPEVCVEMLRKFSKNQETRSTSKKLIDNEHQHNTSILQTSRVDLRFKKSCALVKEAARYMTSLEKDCLNRYLKPKPRLKEGILIRAAGATAMTDISDSLAISLNDFASDSQIGIAIEALPETYGLTIDQTLYGGEDFELLFSIDEDKVNALLSLFERNSLRAPIYIGRSDSKSRTVRMRSRTIKSRGYDHKFK